MHVCCTLKTYVILKMFFFSSIQNFLFFIEIWVSFYGNTVKILKKIIRNSRISKIVRKTQFFEASTQKLRHFFPQNFKFCCGPAKYLLYLKILRRNCEGVCF